MDALGTLANTSANAPKLLFHTVFDGVSLGAATQVSSTNWKVPFANSSDSTTGYDLVTTLQNLWGASVDSRIQCVPQSGYTVSDLTEFATYFDPTLTTNQLSLNCLARHALGASNPQSLWNVSRSTADANAYPINELCIIGYAKLPAGLDLQSGNTASGKYYQVVEFKTGGYGGDSAVGDLRVKIKVTGVNGYNEWVAEVDNNANGRGIIPSVETDVTYYYQNYSGITASPDTWTKYYFYFNRNAGRAIMAIEPDGGIFSVIGNVYPANIPLLGGVLYGHENLPITRVFLGNSYTSANLPAPLLMKELQLWNRPPIELV